MSRKSMARASIYLGQAEEGNAKADEVEAEAARRGFINRNGRNKGKPNLSGLMMAAYEFMRAKDPDAKQVRAE